MKPERLVLLLMALCLLGGRLAHASDARPEVTIGVVIPLTGPLAVYGVEPKRVIQTFEKSALLARSKYRYRFVFEDGQCGAGSASATAAQKLIHRDSARFLLTACSGEALQIAPIAEREKVLMVVVAGSSSQIRESGDFIFRTYPDVSSGVALLVGELRRDGRTRVGVLTEENAVTLGVLDLFEKSAGDITAVRENFRADESDYQSILSRVKARGVDSVFLNTVAPKTYQILYRQLRSQGLTVPVYAYYVPADKSSREVLGKTQDGVKFFTADASDIRSARFGEFLSAYKAVHGSLADAESEFMIQRGFDGVISLLDAIEEVGPEPTLAKSFLYNSAVEGSVGELTFDDKGDARGIGFVVRQIIDGIVSRGQTK